MPVYNHLKDKVRQEINLAKKRWADKSMNTTKGAWSVVNEIRGNKNKDFLNAMLAETSEEKLAQDITDSFISNFNHNPKPPKEEQTSTTNATSADYISIHNVYQAIKHLKKGKSAGSDGISSKMIKLLNEFICEPLYLIYIESRRSNIFPDCWKLADAIPKPKCARPTVSQLRSISLLPIFGKMLERLILLEHGATLIRNFGSHQHAYRPQASCTTALIDMHDTVTTMLDDTATHAVRLIFYDMKAAFDKLRHDLLLQRMTECELDPSFIKWCQSYLSHRRLRVKLRSTYGPTVNCPSSVPQGSVLGPYLFAFFMGSIHLDETYQPSDYHKIVYSDDILSIEKITTNLDKHKSSHQEVTNWSKSNDLVLNDDKTKQIFIKRKKNFVVGNKYDNIKIESTVKYLGVTLNNDLNLKDHVAATCSKAGQRIFILKTVRPILERAELLKIFNGLILSVTAYSAPLLISLDRDSINKLQKIAKRCHYIICGCDETVCKYLCNIFDVIKTQSLKLFRKCTNATHPLHHKIPNKLTHTGKYFVNYRRTNRRANSFFPHMVDICNATT
jgi:hypothetical protein